jgi:hypothetical protein
LRRHHDARGAVRGSGADRYGLKDSPCRTRRDRRTAVARSRGTARS